MLPCSMAKEKREVSGSDVWLTVTLLKRHIYIWKESKDRGGGEFNKRIKGVEKKKMVRERLREQGHVA